MKKLALIALRLLAILIFLFFWSFWLLAELFIKIGTITFNVLRARPSLHESFDETYREYSEGMPMAVSYPAHIPMTRN